MDRLIKKYRPKYDLFIANKFASDGAGWLFLQQLIIAPMSLITTVLLTRVLSIQDYGYYKYVLSIYSIVSIFSFVGIYSITILNIQRGQDYFFNIGFKYKKILRWIPSFISLCIALYYFYAGNNFLAGFFLINIFSYLIVDTYDFYLVALQGRGEYKSNMILGTLYYFFSYFPPIITAYLTQNLYLVFVTMYLFQGLYRFVIFNYVKKTLGLNINNSNNLISLKDKKEFKKEVVSFSFTGAINNLSVNGAGVIVFNRLGAQNNAIYSIALTFADFVSGIISSPLNKTVLLLSKITKEIGYSKDSDLVKIKYIKSLFKKYFWISLFSAISCALLLPFVYKFLFAKYLFSYKYAVIYSVSILAISMYPAYQFAYEKRKFNIINIIQIVVLILNLILLFFASMYFGVWGAIVVAIFIKFLTNLIYIGSMFKDKNDSQ